MVRIHAQPLTPKVEHKCGPSDGTCCQSAVGPGYYGGYDLSFEDLTAITSAQCLTDHLEKHREASDQGLLVAGGTWSFRRPRTKLWWSNGSRRCSASDMKCWAQARWSHVYYSEEVGPVHGCISDQDQRLVLQLKFWHKSWAPARSVRSSVGGPRRKRGRRRINGRRGSSISDRKLWDEARPVRSSISGSTGKGISRWDRRLQLNFDSN